jgi:superfamily II DNA or RNA helicase
MPLPLQVIKYEDTFESDHTPRYYQINTLKQMCLQMRGILDLAPNAGKTFIFANFSHLILQQTQGNVLYLCYGSSLVTQTYNDLCCFLGGENVGLVLRKKVDITKRVTIASVNTLYEHNREFLPFLKSVYCLFLEECHLSTSSTWFVLSMCCTAAYYRFGMSGTPFTGHIVRDLMLVGQTALPIAKITVKELVDLGVSARPHIYCVEVKHPYRYRKYNDAVVQGIVNNDSRHNIIVELVQYELGRDSNCRLLILVERVEHGKKIYDRLVGAGLDSVSYVDGAVSTRKRLDMLAEQVVVASTVADFGLNINIHVEILAGGGKGKSRGKEAVRPIQRLGRSQRRLDGKTDVIVYDIYDVDGGYLEKHAKERWAAWESIGFEPQLVSAGV